MIAVPLDELPPFVQRRPDIRKVRIVDSPARKLPPDHEARPIALIEKLRLKSLLMQASSIEAQVGRQRDFLPHFLFRRNGIQALWMIALVQHEALKDTLPVDHKSFSFKAAIPQSEIRIYLILSKA